MIKKTTIALFVDGDYAGEYDWQGGIPLSVGEVIQITTTSDLKLIYKLIDKTTTLEDGGDDQKVVTVYRFNLSH